MKAPPAGHLSALGAALKLATNWDRFPRLAKCLRQEPAGGEVWSELALLRLRWGAAGAVHAIAVWATINDHDSETPALFVTLPLMQDTKEDPTLCELAELLESFWIAPLPYPGEG